MSLKSRYCSRACQSGPSVKRKPLATLSNATSLPTTARKRGSRISTLTASALLHLADARRPHVPIVGLDVLEHDPDHFLGHLGELGNGVGDAARNLVLALLGMAFEDADVDERHGISPSWIELEGEKPIAQGLVIPQAGCGARKANAPLLQHVNPVGERERELDVLLREHDGKTVLLEQDDLF